MSWGCATRTVPEIPADPLPDFRAVYRAATESTRVVEQAVDDERLLTFSASGMPLETFARVVADAADVSIVVDAGLDGELVSVDVRDVPVSSLLSAVARRLGVEVRRTGRIYSLGALKPEDRGLLVFKSGRLAGDELEAAIATLLSEFGRVQTQGDGVAIVADRVEVLERVAQALLEVDALPKRAWAVQYHLIAISRAAADDYGITSSPGVVASAALASSGAGPAGLSAGIFLDAVVRASSTRDDVDLVASPLLYMGEGREAEVAQVTQIPIPRRVVSAEGTVSTEDFAEVEVGLTVRASLKDLGGGTSELATSVSVGQILGFVEESPIVDVQRINVTSLVASGGTYLLGSIERTGSIDGAETGFTVRRQNESTAGYLALWVRVIEVSAPVIGDRRRKPEATSGGVDASSPSSLVFTSPPVTAEPVPDPVVEVVPSVLELTPEEASAMADHWRNAGY